MDDLGLKTEVKVIRIVDGDTVEVEMVRRFNVRLTHPDGQFHTVDGSQNDKDASEFLEKYIKNSPGVVLFIPANNPNKLMDVNSFNRILGELFYQQQRVTDVMLEKGFGELR
jgi:endonuclease YncB( thermonuclease family)